MLYQSLECGFYTVRQFFFFLRDKIRLKINIAVNYELWVTVCTTAHWIGRAAHWIFDA